MEHDDLDLLLSREEDLVPSSGFVAEVMDAVQREAATPPQIPFPWKRALAGLAASILALIALSQTAVAASANWIALALLLSLVSVRFARRLAGTRI